MSTTHPRIRRAIQRGQSPQCRQIDLRRATQQMAYVTLENKRAEAADWLSAKQFKSPPQQRLSAHA